MESIIKHYGADRNSTRTPRQAMKKKNFGVLQAVTLGLFFIVMILASVLYEPKSALATVAHRAWHPQATVMPL